MALAEAKREMIESNEENEFGLLNGSGGGSGSGGGNITINQRDFDSFGESDPELKKLMMQIEADDLKQSNRNRNKNNLKHSNINDNDDDSKEENGEEYDDENEGEGEDDEEEDELESGEDGYADGEKQYSEWKDSYNLTDNLEDLEPEQEFEKIEVQQKDKFSEVDRQFLGKFDMPLDDYERDGESRWGLRNDENGLGDELSGGLKDGKEMINSDELAALMKSMGFNTETNDEEKDRYARQDTKGGGRVNFNSKSSTEKGRNNKGRNSAVDAGMKGAANILSEYERNDQIFDQNRRNDMDGIKFRSPFSTTPKKPETLESIELSGRRNELLSLLDEENEEDNAIYDKKIRSPTSSHLNNLNSLPSNDHENYNISYREKKQHSYKDPSIREDVKLFSDFTKDEIADEWDMVEFGR